MTLGRTGWTTLCHVETPTEPAPRGVVFPELDGARSTSAVGRAVVWAALSGVDPDGARAAGRAENWHRDYPQHFRRLVESGLVSPESARRIAEDGLAELHRRMRWIDGDRDVRLADLVASTPQAPRLSTVTVEGAAPPASFGLPLDGRVLRGAALSEQLDRWAGSGVLEPSAAAAIERVAEHPEWLSLPGRTVVCLGAGAEIGPLHPLLSWGATVAAVDLPGPDRWRRLADVAAGSAGRLIVPVGAAGDGVASAGVDLLTGLPQLGDWVSALDSTLVLGNYVYADGGAHVAAAAGADALLMAVRARQADVVAAYLATPTDVFCAPPEAVLASTGAFARRGTLARSAGAVLGVLTRGRALRPNYPPLEPGRPGIHDAIVRQQGPNYALAKRIQRWRASAEWADGRRVSLNVAPPTRTRSVIKNRTLDAAYAGAHRFGVTVFEPDTTRVLMAALLVHDLLADLPTGAHPWELEADQAIHGGLWRAPYAPRSALPLAAIGGYPATGRPRRAKG